MSTEKTTRTYSLEEAKAEIERLIEEMVTGESIRIQREDDGFIIYQETPSPKTQSGGRPHS